MMQWSEQPSDIIHNSIADWPGQLTILELCKLFQSKSCIPLVAFQEDVEKSISDHVGSIKTELGGLLIGKVYMLPEPQSNRIALIEITNSISSEVYESTRVSLKMDTDLWNKARDHLDESSIVVGWYHSHPDLGAFFSGTDRRNQAAAFHHSYSLGLVVDPIRNEKKWFIGPNSLEVPEARIITCDS